MDSSVSEYSSSRASPALYHHHHPTPKKRFDTIGWTSGLALGYGTWKVYSKLKQDRMSTPTRNNSMNIMRNRHL